jgi:hypothetical protein
LEEIAQMNETPGTRPSRRTRAGGALGQGVGVLGIAVCLLLALGALLASGWASARVDDVAGGLDGGVAQVLPLVDAASAEATEVSTQAGALAVAADQVAVDPAAVPARLQAVLARVSTVSNRYLVLRGSYAGIREQAVSLLDRLRTFDELVPAVAIPQGPVDRLAALDARARALDARVMALINAGAAAGAVNETARRVADEARGVESAMGEVSVALGEVEGQLNDLRAGIASAAGSVKTAILLVALVLVVLLLYLAGLHLLLFRWSRGMGRTRAVAAEPSIATGS